MPAIIAIVVAALLGAAWGETFGAVALALIAWLGIRSFKQERQIAALDKALHERGAAPAGVAAAASAPAAIAPADAEPEVAADVPVFTPMVVAPTEERPAAADEVPDIALPLEESPAPRPAHAAASTPAPARPGVFAGVIGWFFGGNTIVKAGVGILFIGLAFLAKYASEHVSVPVELRLAGIGGVALALLAVGWRLRLSRPGYAQVLQGGAVAVLYLTLFVAFRFYGVLAVGPVFGLMVAVAALAAALAVLQDARSLAVIGALGGFATPLLVSTGSGNHVALFSYYLVLDLGIAAVAWYRTWRVLNLVGFVFTFFVATAWGVLKYRPGDYATSQAFLIGFFVLFVAIMLMPARRLSDGTEATGSRSDAWVNGGLLFGLPTIAFVLQYGLVRDTEYGTALSALALAAFYVVLATWMRARPRLALAFEGSLAVGTVFLTLVIPFALDARSTAGAWALEGAGLVWLGFRQSRGLARAFGYALLVLAGGALLYANERHGVPRSVLDPQLFNGVLIAIAALAAALFVHRHADAKHGESIAEVLLIGWASLWLVIVAGQEIVHFVAQADQLAAMLAAASVVALAYTALSQRFDWPMVAMPVPLQAATMLLGVAMLTFTLDDPLAHGGWWAWPLALATHAVVLWRAAPRWPAPLASFVHALGALLLAALGALLGRQLTSGWGDAASAWPWLGWLALPALLLLWLPRPAVAQRWPLRLAPPAYQGAAAGVLAFGALAWTLLANIVSDGSARPLPHVPLANPLDLGIGVALFAAALWLRSAPGIAVFEDARIAPALLAGAGFVWLNAMLIRAFHHYGGVPFRVDAWVDSLAVQTGLTLLWTATALVTMWLAARRTARAPWMAGAALLGAVVFKLLLVDLSGSGTVTRIVSFIGVGVLMLVIGYVAPLPAREERHATP